ncbi:hypothetical protein PILCRDRAFT_93583 [Piloderma croceum F 1598]|uniref:Uncharacterized protein n=1 Tax=Piloderma croceum (strain F 1598) TaxID=765440 RepID=A0A0C3AEF9_PILCF|nr:hypothetical protein PILCRDRAFT_93583 [Piloderma croceum F 1598]
MQDTPGIHSTELIMYRAQAVVAHSVLQFKQDSNSMEQVHPGSFRHHRDIRQMLGPCCLCPKIDTVGPDYVESAIYVATTGPFASQYVFGHARDKCGYMVFLKMYELRVMKDLAAQGDHAPPIPRHNSEESLLVNGRSSLEGQVQVPNHLLLAAAMPSTQGRPLRPLKLSYAMLDINVASPVPEVAGPVGDFKFVKTP